MRVRAFMPLFDEADIAAWSIPHLIRQGIEVYVIDGWSNRRRLGNAARSGSGGSRTPAS